MRLQLIRGVQETLYNGHVFGSLLALFRRELTLPAFFYVPNNLSSDRVHACTKLGIEFDSWQGYKDFVGGMTRRPSHQGRCHLKSGTVTGF